MLNLFLLTAAVNKNRVLKKVAIKNKIDYVTCKIISLLEFLKSLHDDAIFCYKCEKKFRDGSFPRS